MHGSPGGSAIRPSNACGRDESAEDTEEDCFCTKQIEAVPGQRADERGSCIDEGQEGRCDQGNAGRDEANTYDVPIGSRYRRIFSCVDARSASA